MDKEKYLCRWGEMFEIIILFGNLSKCNEVSFKFKFDVWFKSKLKFGLNLKVALSHRGGLCKFSSTPKELKLYHQYIPNTAFLVKYKILSHASTYIMSRLNFWSPFLHCFPCLLVTYLLFLNICSRSKEHSGRLQSGQNFCESWSSGNKFSGNIFHAQFSQFSPQEDNNAL